jgi:hypothetical protein
MGEGRPLPLFISSAQGIKTASDAGEASTSLRVDYAADRRPVSIALHLSPSFAAEFLCPLKEFNACPSFVRANARTKRSRFEQYRQSRSFCIRQSRSLEDNAWEAGSPWWPYCTSLVQSMHECSLVVSLIFDVKRI